MAKNKTVQQLLSEITILFGVDWLIHFHWVNSEQ